MQEKNLDVKFFICYNEIKGGKKIIFAKFALAVLSAADAAGQRKEGLGYEAFVPLVWRE